MNTARLKHARGSALGRLTRIASFLEDFDSSTHDQGEVEVRYEKMASIEQDFMNFHQQIMSSCLDEGEMSEQEQKLIDFENQLYAVSAKVKLILKSFAALSTPSESEPSQQPAKSKNAGMKLPPITVAPFKGDPLDWIRFKEMFEVVFGEGSSTTDDLERFHRLREFLAGPALKLIGSLTYTASSYRVAMKMLEKRFEDIHLLVTLHIQNILNFPPLQKECGNALCELVDTVNSNLASLKTYDQDVNSFDMLIVTIVNGKLDPTSRVTWESQIPEQGLSTWEIMEKCLSKRAKVLKATNPAKLQARKSICRGEPSNNFAAFIEIRCQYCHKAHSVSDCNRFKRLTRTKKYQFLKQQRICFNCLQGAHRAVACHKRAGCSLCPDLHHHLLHSGKKLMGGLKCSPPQKNDKYPRNAQRVLLATARVWIKDSSGVRHPCRALLDNCSQDHFMSEQLAKRMKLTTTPLSVPVCGINNTSSNVKCFVSTEMSSMVEKYERTLDFLVVKKVAASLPSTSININSWRIPDRTQLADPDFHKSSSVDLLIGAENFLEMLKVGRLTLDKGLPLLQNTRLGWIASGKFTEKLIQGNFQQSTRPKFNWTNIHHYFTN